MDIHHVTESNIAQRLRPSCNIFNTSFITKGTSNFLSDPALTR